MARSFVNAGFLRFLLIGGFLVLGCNKPENYLYLHPDAIVYSKTQKVREVVGDSDIDMFWAVGGMAEQAANFEAGISQFITDFSRMGVARGFTWRMAVTASNLSQAPTLGMPTVFDNTAPNPIPTFSAGIVAGLNGEDAEKIFDPVAFHLQHNPTFVRPGATLVVIITNDAHDSSTSVTSAIQMLNFLVALKNGVASKVIVYGIFGSTDLNCPIGMIDEDWNYHGTEFEKLIKATGGKVYSLCDTNFGTSLGKIGDDLYQRLDRPIIRLDHRPDPKTIRVIFNGADLPGGDQATGGIWYYDVDSNAIIFYNLNFSQATNEQVTVQYVEDTGVH